MEKTQPLHTEKHPLVGKTVRLKDDIGAVPGPLGDISGKEMRVDDWYDRLVGHSWGEQPNNWVNVGYAARVFTRLVVPADDEVVYGHIGGLAVAVHNSEIDEVV